MSDWKIDPPDDPPMTACMRCGGDGCRECEWEGEVLKVEDLDERMAEDHLNDIYGK